MFNYKESKMRYDLFLNDSLNSGAKQQNAVTSQNQIPSINDSQIVGEKFSSKNRIKSTSQPPLEDFWSGNQLMTVRNEILLDIRDYLAFPIVFGFLALIILFIWIIILTIKIF